MKKRLAHTDGESNGESFEQQGREISESFEREFGP
jgi:hypothetical protein